MKPSSLRARLTLIILPPLLIISLIAGAWQFHNTTLRAESIFDKGLLSAAIAISRDVALSDGDAISPSTRRLLADTSGGTIFYHVFAPDGVFVTGYSTPPVLPSMAPKGATDPFYYNSVYQGENVRVLRFQDVTLVSGIAGIFNITVWQNASVRSSFVRNVLSRSFAVIAALVMSVAIVVWFGVRLGLRPLLELERAIAKRTPSELEPIRRAVPTEAQGLVTTLNGLLNRVSRRISSKDEFISNAAHQLRNPMAGVLALAEAVTTAPNPQTAQKRSAELLQAAREASDLTNKLLSFERASGTDVSQTGRPMDLNQLIAHAVSTFEQNHPKASLTGHPRSAARKPVDSGRSNHAPRGCFKYLQQLFGAWRAKADANLGHTPQERRRGGNAHPRRWHWNTRGTPHRGAEPFFTGRRRPWQRAWPRHCGPCDEKSWRAVEHPALPPWR
jgi:two-component system sensor histidine kinase TctE